MRILHSPPYPLRSPEASSRLFFALIIAIGTSLFALLAGSIAAEELSPASATPIAYFVDVLGEADASTFSGAADARRIHALDSLDALLVAYDAPRVAVLSSGAEGLAVAFTDRRAELTERLGEERTLLVAPAGALPPAGTLRVTVAGVPATPNAPADLAVPASETKREIDAAVEVADLAARLLDRASALGVGPLDAADLRGLLVHSASPSTLASLRPGSPAILDPAAAFALLDAIVDGEVVLSEVRLTVIDLSSDLAEDRELGDESRPGEQGASAEDLALVVTNGPGEVYFQPTIEAGSVAAYTGAVSYSVPLDIPGGVGGLRVPLVLRYNSERVNGKNTSGDSDGGWLGLGWDLDVGRIALTGGTTGQYRATFGGESVILRARNGATTGACADLGSWTCESERFERLDAEELNFWKVEKTSREWRDNVCACTAPSCSWQSVDGVVRDDSKFQIWTKNGTRYDFGVDDFAAGPFGGFAGGGTGSSSRLYHVKYRDGGGVDEKEAWYRGWGLERVVDPEGNTVEIDYQSFSSKKWQHNCALPGGAGLPEYGWKENYPSEIRYTTNPGQGDTHAEWRVVFDLAPKGIDTLDDRSIAQSGVILEGIQVWFHPVGSPAELVREYRFEYLVDTSNDRTSYRMRRMRRFGQGGQAAGHELPELWVGYTSRTIRKNGTQHSRYFTSIVRERGGELTWTYSDYEHPGSGAFRKQVASSLTRDPGLGAVRTSTFTYADPATQPQDDGSVTLLGFGTFTETFPDRVEQSLFHAASAALGADEPPLNGKRHRHSVWSLAGQELSRGETTWQATQYDLNYRVDWIRKTRVLERLWDDHGTQHVKRRDFGYDSAGGKDPNQPLYGNLLHVFDYDTASGGTPWRSTAYFYTANESAWIVDRKWQEAVYEGPLWTEPYLKKTRWQWNDSSTPEPYGVDARRRLFAVREFTKDGATAPERVKDTRYVHDAFGNRTQVKTYDTWGTETAFPSSAARTTVTRYDDDHHVWPRKVTNALGHVTRIYRYGVNEMSTSGSGLPGQVQARRDEANNVLYDGAEYDAFGRVLYRWEAGLGGVGAVDWWNPAKASLQVFYDDAQQMRRDRVRYDNGSGSSFLPSWTFFDAFGRVVQTQRDRTSSVKEITNTEYDAEGRTIRETVPALVTWPDDLLNETEWQASHPAVYRSYDELGRLRTITQLDGSTITRDYDGPWGDVTVTDAEGRRTTRQVFDRRGHHVQTIETDLQNSHQVVTNRVYDALGRLLEVRDAENNSILSTFDPLGRRVTELDPDRGATVFTYGPAGTLVEQENAAGERICLWTDALDRPIAKQFRLSTCPTSVPAGADRYHYDIGTNGVGRLTSTVTADVTRTFGYDERGRKTSESVSIVGAPQSTYTTTWQYDEMDRVRTMIYPDGSNVKPTYKTWGPPEMLKLDGNHLVSDTYYNYRRQRTAIFWGNGLRTEMAYYGAPEAFRQQWLKVGTTADTDLHEKYRYWYDDNANITKIRDFRGSTSAQDSDYQEVNFAYDFLDRLRYSLAYLAGSGLYNLTYQWDDLGNLESVVDGLDTVTFGYHSSRPHAKTHVDGVERMTYDSVGRMTSRFANGYPATYAWRADDRLESSILADGSTVDFVRDIDGSLVKKIVSSGTGPTTYYVGEHFEVVTTPSSGGGGGGGGGGTDPCCNGTRSSDECPQVICDTGIAPTGDTIPAGLSFGRSPDYKSVDVEETAYFFHDGERVAYRHTDASSAQTLRYLHRDHLGSTAMVSDEAGNVVSRARYRPFGRERWSSGSAGTDFRFTGERAHEGMGEIHEMGVRFYDPVYFQWLSADTIVPDVTRSQSLNRYAYVEGNPVRFVDPTGHMKDDLLGHEFGDESGGWNGDDWQDYGEVGSDAWYAQVQATVDDVSAVSDGRSLDLVTETIDDSATRKLVEYVPTGLSPVLTLWAEQEQAWSEDNRYQAKSYLGQWFQLLGAESPMAAAWGLQEQATLPSAERGGALIWEVYAQPGLLGGRKQISDPRVPESKLGGVVKVTADHVTAYGEGLVIGAVETIYDYGKAVWEELK